MPPRTILLVDPDPLQRQLVDMLLAEDGHHLVNAGSGREALEFLKEHTPHLVLMALELPDLAGDEVCRKLKSVSRLAPVPVLLVADPPGRAGLPSQLRERARAVGADQLLQKPLGDKGLRERVRRLLSRWETTAGSGGAPAKATNTAVIEEALEALAEGAGDTAAGDAMAAALYRENAKLRQELASLRRRLARWESGADGPGGGRWAPPRPRRRTTALRCLRAPAGTTPRRGRRQRAQRKRRQRARAAGAPARAGTAEQGAAESFGGAESRAGGCAARAVRAPARLSLARQERRQRASAQRTRGDLLRGRQVR